MSAYKRHPLTGGLKCRVLVEKLPGLQFGVCFWEVSACRRCLLMGGIRLWEVSAYGRCLRMGGVRLQEVSAYRRCPLMGGVR